MKIMKSYLEFIEKNHIKPMKLNQDEKQKYYLDLQNISNSWTGRTDIFFANSFIQESAYLLVNAISLFENGYFDCAYYSLRQSLEVSTTMNYLSELDSELRDKKFYKWKTQEQFPMNKQMLDFLKKNKEIYFDMFNNMNNYFNMLEITKKKLNKFVHKQGYQYFYVTRNHPLNSKYNEKDYIKEFINYLKICIGAVAVFRLGIDPMPILLMDEDIYFRTEDMLTTPFSKEFVEEYIGLDHINSYMKTAFYKEHYNIIMKIEKQSKYIADIKKNNYIDKTKTKEILKQKHLLNQSEYILVSICDLIDKVVKAYTVGGLHMYFTNLKTARIQSSWNTGFFSNLSNNDKHINQPFDEAYISYFNFGEDLDVYLEHNELLIKDEINLIKNINIKL